MAYRAWFSVTIHLALWFPLLPAVAFAQQEPTTEDQVIAKYLEAVGASHYSSVTTLMEIGDRDWEGSESPMQAQNRHGTFEYYFKSPNLRFSSHVSQNKVIALYGCDGRVAWQIDANLNRTETQPKPGSASECEAGFKPALSGLLESKPKMRLLKEKAVEGSTAWEIKIDDPKSPEKLYFDTKTFLLLRSQRPESSVTYSDYRDVGGIKIPFKVTLTFMNYKLVTTVRELKINTPIDDARFVEPKVKDRIITFGEVASTKNNSTPVEGRASTTATAATDVDVPAVPPSKVTATTDTTSVVEINFPNFTSCAIKELQLTVPELKGLKAAVNQEGLATLLDKIGAKTLDIARNTPNLIARETVVQSGQGVRETRRDYDYLILPRITEKLVGLDEFRVDLKSGEKFETEATRKESSTRTDLEPANHDLTQPQGGRPPASQGFATSWVYFYPSNRSQAIFRYLGEEKVDGRRTHVLAFAQKPESVVSPAMVQYQGRLVPMFLQGVAWVDPSDFRILRLRTDLLAPVPEVSLHRLTADIQFGLTRIERVSSQLSLPHEVTVTSEIGGSNVRETHKYSGYRLFRAQSKIVLNP